MPSVKDLLKTSTSTFKAPPRFPAGSYIVVIESYDMLPFSWAKANTHGLAYCPSIKPISSVEADDDSQPEIQAEQIAALEKYGDWTAKTFQFAYTSKDTQQRMAQVSEINFPLIETDADHEEALGILEKHAWRFFREEDGTKSGFVVDILGLDPKPGTELGDLMEATVGRKFMISFVYTPNSSDPSRPPNFEVQSITCL